MAGTHMQLPPAEVPRGRRSAGSARTRGRDSPRRPRERGRLPRRTGGSRAGGGGKGGAAGGSHEATATGGSGADDTTDAAGGAHGAGGDDTAGIADVTANAATTGGTTTAAIADGGGGARRAACTASPFRGGASHPGIRAVAGGTARKGQTLQRSRAIRGPTHDGRPTRGRRYHRGRDGRDQRPRRRTSHDAHRRLNAPPYCRPQCRPTGERQIHRLPSRQRRGRRHLQCNRCLRRSPSRHFTQRRHRHHRHQPYRHPPRSCPNNRRQLQPTRRPSCPPPTIRQQEKKAGPEPR